MSESTNAQPARHLAAAIERQGARSELFETGTAPDAAAIAEAKAKATASDLVVVATANASGSVSQLALVNALIDTRKPVVVVATRNPYDVADLDRARTYLATYSWTKPAMRATARALFGRIEPSGKLPVRIPSAADPNVTLYPYGFGLGY